MSALLDTGQIATMLGVSRGTACSVVRSLGFPPPTSEQPRMWAVAEVSAFLCPSAPHLLTVIPQAARNETPEKSLEAHLTRITTDAARRSRRVGRPFSIQRSDVRTMFDAQEGRCAVSGMRFNLQRTVARAPAPFAPSLDRIECKRGYEPGNVRLVCCAINLMMNVWGDAVFHRIAEEIRGGK